MQPPVTGLFTAIRARARSLGAAALAIYGCLLVVLAAGHVCAPPAPGPSAALRAGQDCGDAHYTAPEHSCSTCALERAAVAVPAVPFTPEAARPSLPPLAPAAPPASRSGAPLLRAARGPPHA